jgi:hypothetical protein
MKNRDVYEKDPSQNKLLNQGVAKVTSGHSTPELETLRFELSNFVCDGQYAAGLARILTTYIGHLDKPEQPGVWVSGFFGSGKSHLVKVLQHLWNDFTFPDGARARGLARLPDNIKELLVEQSAAAKRAGGAHAAAGALGTSAADKSIRLELLGILFKSVDLPEHYHTASFILWMRQEGIEDQVRKHVAAAKRDFDFEVSNLYVSDVLAKAILAARPGFAASPADVKTLLQSQFAEKSDISIDEMIAKIKAALTRNGKLPLTLLVLDEVQQYIGDSIDRSKSVQDVQEQICSRLGSRVIFVATGQNALSGTAHLQRLQGRFPVTVELQDTDVERVTREVVLKKKPSSESTVKKELEDQSGEIERHLKNSKIGFNSRDRGLLVQDYPLLPTRRRFWERVLRAVDKAGTGAQLRTQLWIVYDAVEKTADLPLGNVVSASFLFEHIQSKVLQSGVLLQEISETIAKQVHEKDGDLRRQICALIFLIGQLPHEGPNDAGIRADAAALADLLVTDLNAGSVELRKKIPELLKLLADDGAIMQVENEYRMQTREGSEWNKAYVEAMNKLLADTGKLAGERSQLLRTHCSEMLDKRKLLHGTSKEPRKFELHFGPEAPPAGTPNIPVWIRDGWDVTEKTVQSDARAAGDAPIVYGYIPARQAEELKGALARYYAASTTVQSRGSPSTPEGIEAKKAMETRRDLAERERNKIVSDILHDTTIYIAGGDTVPGITLDAKVHDAATACLDRLYDKFHLADSADWHKVIDRARKGDGDALSVVGHKGDPEAHPVCSAILSYISSGKKGTEIRKQFVAPPYGWPQDAIDAALIVMHRAGLILARNGSEQLPKDKLDQKNITTLEFRVENQPLSTVQLIALRGLFKDVGIDTLPGQESTRAVEYLNALKSRAEKAGGNAPAPKSPDTADVTDLLNRAGNDQLKAIFDQRDDLKKQAAQWKERSEMIARREPPWRTLKELRDHAGDLPVYGEVKAEIDAIESGRQLLADPDPVPAVSARLTQALRDALNTVYADCSARFKAGNDQLAASPVWEKTSASDKSRLLLKHQVADLVDISVGTTEEVLHSLRSTRLKEWRNLRDALPTRFAQLLQDAAKLLEPKAQHISLPSATIKSEAELSEWLAAVEQQIKARLKEGPVIV